MKKLILSMALLTGFSQNIAFAITTNVVPNIWNGVYVGLKAGYWFSPTNTTNTHARVDFFNSSFPLGSEDITTALIEIGTNHAEFQTSGIMGGGLLGYNYSDLNYLIGVEIELGGLTNNDAKVQVNQNIQLVNFPESYQSTFTIKEKINYLGGLRARLGYLFQPNLLFYLTGGLAFGEPSFDESVIAKESLSSFIYPTATVSDHDSSWLFGFTVGTGIEWAFASQWSVKLEYLYYDLGTKHKSFLLQQYNNLDVPPALWASVNVSSAAKFRSNTFQLGINYHFC